MKTSIWIALIVVSMIIATIIIIQSSSKHNDQELISIGVLLPLTGEVAGPGNKVLHGLQIAIQEHNRMEDTKIKLIVEDSMSQPKDGVSAFNKLINADGVRVVVGDLMSSTTLAVAPIAERKGIVLLAPGASNPKVRDAGDYIFRNWASDNFDGLVMADYVYHKLGRKQVCVIFVNNDYGLGLAEAFREQFLSNGGAVICFEGYSQGTTEFRPILAKTQGLDFDSFYLPGQPRENGLLVKQIMETGIANSKSITANLSVESTEFFEIVGDGGVGIIYSTPMFDLESEDKLTVQFIEAYEKNHGGKPDVCAAHGYDAGRILSAALRDCDYNISQLKDSLYAIKNMPGVTGTTSFDEKGDVHKDVMIKEITGRDTGLLPKNWSSFCESIID